ncbi:MAG: hypothetical protein EXS01_00620 [Phycisphaerales bacterium]|nr:hypothetical protein [Phycisphaerales bacterium]
MVTRSGAHTSRSRDGSAPHPLQYDQFMTLAPTRRLLVVGWDAADWIIIDRLIAAGRMPTLKAAIDAGVRADLRTLEPKLSPLLWTSITTGKTADKHGILNFVEPKADGSGLQVATSTSRSGKALWNILSQSGIRTHTVGWYASHPAEPIVGGVVSNLLQEGEPSAATSPWPLVDGSVSPALRRERVAALRQRAANFPAETLRALLPSADTIGRTSARVATLCKLMAYATSIRAIACDALRNDAQWQCGMVFFDAIDTVGHHFMQFVPPRMAHVSERELRQYSGVMDAVYEWHDQALRDLLAAAGPDTTLILLSDHGFHSDHLRPVLADLAPERRAELESSWHRPLGVLVMSGGGIRAGSSPALPIILDIAPTALALFGLAAGEDMDGRVLSESLTQSTIPPRIASWEEVEGNSGLHPAEARLNTYEAADAITQLIDLGYMAALPADVQGQLDLVRRESLFNLGVVQMSRQRFNEGAVTFQRLVDQRPTDPRYVLCLARCLGAQFHLDGATSVLRTLIAHDSECLDARLLLAALLAQSARGADSAAIAEFDAQLTLIIAAAKGRPQLEAGLGTALVLAGRHAQAIAHFEVAKKHDARQPAAHIGLARVALVQGDFENAIERALDALEVSQTAAEAHCILGAALAWSGDLDNAAISLLFALRHEGANIEALHWISRVESVRNNSAAANQHRERAAQLMMNSRLVLYPEAHDSDAFARARAINS